MLAADLGAQRRIRGKFSKGHQPAGWRVARLAAAHPSENLIINPDVVQPAIRQVDAFVALPVVCRSLRSLLNHRLTEFNPRQARVVPILADRNKITYIWPEAMDIVSPGRVPPGVMDQLRVQPRRWLHRFPAMTAKTQIYKREIQPPPGLNLWATPCHGHKCPR